MKKLKPVASAPFSQGDPCMDGTRIETLRKISSWSEGSSSPTTLFVHGFAGSGKSSIAASVCEIMRRKKVLAGAFFCKRDVPDQRDSRRILSSLSFSLANLYEPYRLLIAKTLENEVDISATPVQYQLTTLFTMPLSELQTNSLHQPLVFVIDALDECSDGLAIAKALCQIASHWLKVFITSRPQPGVMRVFSPLKNGRIP